MHERRIPEWLRHAPVPSVRDFGILAGLEAVVRGTLISVFPLIMYRALGDAGLVSASYFAVGILSLLAGLMIPALIRLVPRRWAYSLGALMFVASAGFAIEGSPASVLAALALNTVAAVTTFICFNAYVLDYISRVALGQCETSRMFYSALGWTAGPVAGVLLLEVWPPAPFLISAAAALLMLAAFWWMRMGNGKQIARARGPASSPLAYVPRFLAQPRLVAGWLFAVIRSAGWWIYVVYLPIFAIEKGLGEELGGILLSVTNAALFGAPLLQRWVQRHSIRLAVQTGFLGVTGCFGAAALAQGWPPAAIALLVAGSAALILLDICAGLPFLMAVKPSERTEMSAVYSSYRDISGILTPGVAWLVLLAAPVAGIFAAGAAATAGAVLLAGNLHPRLGRRKPAPAPGGNPVPAE
ncbi:MFS transporter [Leisingera methylohalidivorans]|uniref:MFS transporter n=1 Tax=Leisingera methylohalidivorans DSM 14336 TaxID=999552 RepID=V9VR71_9RHOB|nr:MFS transporter [Leisingera methylohalidivorans]AHD00209.1 MFS transporter [Leisingera methylohalidivorans DSM 14336]